LACCRDFLEQFLLPSGQSKMSARRCLASHEAGILTQRENRDISLDSCRYGFLHPSIGPIDDTDTPRVSEMLLTDTLSQCSTQGRHVFAPAQSAPRSEHILPVIC